MKNTQHKFNISLFIVQNRMLRRELHQLNEIKKASTADKCTQTIEDQSLVSTNKKKLSTNFLLIAIIV